MVCALSPLSASADSPQPGILQVALVSKTVSLGEPVVMAYKVTNVEGRRIGSNINEDPRRWLSISLIDAVGRSLTAAPAAAQKPMHGGITLSQGSVINANTSSTNSVTGFIVVGQATQPIRPGQYRLRLSAHQKYYWDEAPGEPVTVDQDFLLPLTVTDKDPYRLLATAEKYRQDVLHGDKYQTAIKALFSMRDPECLPVWRKLATDPSLDAFRATEVMDELARINSISASDILADMHPVAPERWARTGLDPLNALESMRRTAGPELTQHINRLLVTAGVNLNHVPYGSVN